MIEYRITTKDDIELLKDIRLETLRVVNGLEEDHRFPDVLLKETENYFLSGDQTTVIAVDDGKVIGCASICYMRIMPTFSHPTGRRAHLMNVYTAENYRRQGIAQKMATALIEAAWEKGATEISLDATDDGRRLYKKLGFTDSDECMVLIRKQQA